MTSSAAYVVKFYNSSHGLSLLTKWFVHLFVTWKESLKLKMKHVSDEMFLKLKLVRTSPILFECSSMLPAFLWLEVLTKTIGMYYECQCLWYETDDD